MEISLPVKQSDEQIVAPKGDGRLQISSPDDTIRYDMGNQKLFATLDGAGNVTRVLQTDGYWIGHWKTNIKMNGQTIYFDTAEAIGRLWVLKRQEHNTDITLSSFLDEKSAVLYQRLTVYNNHEKSGDSNGDKSSKLHVGLHISIRPTLSLVERIRDSVVRFLSRFSRFETWWGSVGSKKIHPRPAHELVSAADAYIEAKGPLGFVWGADSLPVAKKCGKNRGILEYVIDLSKSGSVSITWAVSTGSSKELESVLLNSNAALENAHGYVAWLNSKYGGDPEDYLLRSLFVSGLNAAVAMFKELPQGFAGLLAGPDYGYPPRLYFRDGYWTAQILLKTRPDLVRRHLLSLAKGVHPDGSCPSGVFAPHILEENPGIQSHDWLPDHYDSPSFFILLVEEYINASGDHAVLDEQVELFFKQVPEQRYTLGHLVHLAAKYMISLDSDNDGLIEKPYEANDWADNVYRNTWVTYDQALYVAALFAMDRLTRIDEKQKNPVDYRAQAEKANAAMNSVLWDNRKGYFANYARDGFVEDNFSIDTLVALRYGLVTPEREKRVLEAAKSLQTRRNPRQQYGDWGIMCAYPCYKQPRDLFDKSADSYRYHNGSDWPYWDGVYAEILYRRGDDDWRYVVSRWWEYSLSQGWLTPPEYFSPPYVPGGMLQGWSAMPATVLLA